MSTDFRNPLEGYPQTTETIGPDGLPTFRISLKTLSPERARWAHSAADTMCLWFILLGAYALWISRAQVGVADVVVALLVVVAAERLLPRFVENMLRESGEIEMSAQAVAVRRGRGWDRYNRLLEHRFALKEHDFTDWERRQLDYVIRDAGTEGKAVNPTVYFGESANVVLVYAGHRQDLATVWGRAEAAAIVERLQYCDDCLNKALSMGGAAQTPADEWSDGPGGIR
jgi:hypothetical protein